MTTDLTYFVPHYVSLVPRTLNKIDDHLITSKRYQGGQPQFTIKDTDIKKLKDS